MDKQEIKLLLEQANNELEIGNCKSAYSLLLPLLEKKIPEALFLYSRFSIGGTETDQEFEERSFSLLIECSNLKYPPALYSLGVCYDTGDLVDRDSLKAALLFKNAAERGYSKAKLNYGLDLFYGSNGIPRDKSLGISYVEEAVDAEVEGSDDYLKEIKSQPKAGL